MSGSWQKDLLWQTWDSFLINLALIMFYVPYCTGFYIYTLTATIFREELKQIINRCVHGFFPQRQMDVANVTSTAHDTHERRLNWRFSHLNRCCLFVCPLCLHEIVACNDWCKWMLFYSCSRYTSTEKEFSTLIEEP